MPGSILNDPLMRLSLVLACITHNAIDYTYNPRDSKKSRICCTVRQAFAPIVEYARPKTRPLLMRSSTGRARKTMSCELQMPFLYPSIDAVKNIQRKEKDSRRAYLTAFRRVLSFRLRGEFLLGKLD